MNVADAAGDAEKAYASHYVGSKSFGWVVSFMSLFSTIYSGYTINGVPTEAAGLGFYSVRWLTSVPFIWAAFLLFIPRLRRTSITRNYTSPTDMITDRFNNRFLSFLVFILFTLNNWVYAVANFYTLNAVLKAVASRNGVEVINSEQAVWGFAILILVAEVFGGFRAVAFSDTIQTAIMIFAMVSIACIFENDYGGMAGTTQSLCDNSRTETLCGSKGTGVCAEKTVGCLYNVAPHLVLPPHTGESDHYKALWWNSTSNDYADSAIADPKLFGIDGSSHYNYTPLRMFSFNMLFIAFALNPHWLIRFMSARSDSAVKKVNLVFCIAPLLVTLPGMVEGMVAKAEYGGQLPASNAGFGFITNAMMAQGGFRMVIGILAVCASFAAIMSTTDSTVLTISNMITTDIVRNGIAPDISAKNLDFASKFASMVSIISCTAFALYYDPLYDTSLGYSIYGRLISFQNTILWQLMPAFFICYFIKKASGWAVAIGVVTGFIVGVGLTAEVQYEAKSAYGGVMPGGDDLYLDGGLWGAMANIIVVTLLTCVLPDKDMGPTFPDAVMKKFGAERLSLEIIDKAMEKTTEPAKHPFGIFVMLFHLVVGTICLPWYEDGYGGCKAGWNTGGAKGLPTTQDGCDPGTLVNGLPRWFVGCLVYFLLAMFLNFACWLVCYNTEDEESWFGPMMGKTVTTSKADEPVAANEVEKEISKEDYAV